MSKKLNTSVGGTPTNTLLNYFSKSPAFDKKKLTPSVKTDPDASKSEKENLQNQQPKVKDGKKEASKPAAKRKLPISDDEPISGQRKRKRIVQPESDSEPEMEVTKSEDDFSDCASDYEPDENEASDDSVSSGAEEVSPSENDMSVDSPTPKKSRKKSKILNNNNNNEPSSKKVKLESTIQLAEGATFQEKLKNLQSNAKQDASYDDIVTNTSNLDEPVVWPHQKLEFLQPDKIKDKEGRRPDHPDYDKSTLHVPEKFLNGLSPGVRQWWVLKSDNYDCVLFFKVGKFYELYHMDADVGVNELGFTYMRGEFAHSGFPEISFDKMSTILVDRGFKVICPRIALFPSKTNTSFSLGGSR